MVFPTRMETYQVHKVDGPSEKDGNFIKVHKVDNPFYNDGNFMRPQSGQSIQKGMKFYQVNPSKKDGNLLSP